MTTPEQPTLVEALKRTTRFAAALRQNAEEHFKADLPPVYEIMVGDAAAIEVVLAALSRAAEAQPRGGVEEMAHAANEWAGAFYAAVQWLRNVDNETSTVSGALVSLEDVAAHCQKVWADARALTQPPQPVKPSQAGEGEAMTALRVITDAVGRYRELGPLKGVRADLARGYEMAIRVVEGGSSDEH